MNYSITKQKSDTGKEVYVYENDKTKIPLNSLYSPEKEAIRFLKKLNSIEKHVVVIIGFGNGVLLDLLIDSEFLNKNIHVLFIEPLSEVELSDKHFSMIKDNEKLSYMNSENLTSLQIANYLSKFISIPISIQVQPNYLKIDSYHIDKCIKTIKEGIETKKIFNNTETKFAVDWIVEPLLNFRYISKSKNLKDFKDKFKGEKAFLVAAGPSLNGNMSLLKESKDSSYIFAVGSALRALLMNDISPDFALSLDASDRNYETHFKDLNYTGTLIYETMSNSNIQKNHKGELVVSRALPDQITSLVFDDLYSFSHSSPSVAIFTLQVIVYLGFSEVYLVGQDLALVGGNYYAEGVKHHEGMKDSEVELWVEDNQGKQVGTTNSLNIFLKTFESLIKTLCDDVKIYNLSKYGAKIKGVPYLALTEVEPHDKNVRLDKVQCMSSIDSESLIKEIVQKLISLKEETDQANRKLKRIIEMGVVSSEDMIKVVKGFRKVTEHKILEEVILSQLTYLFNNITNKFKYLEQKEKYLSDDLLEMIKELSKLYNLVEKYINEIINDERLTNYK